MKINTKVNKLRRKSTLRKTERKNTIKNEYISNYQSSESIVKLLLDKIINISIHQSDMNKINRQINSYCFEYLQNQIDPLCEETFMNYTKLKNDTNTLFWKATKPPENQWIEIMEPEPVQNDRYENSEIHVVEIQNKKPPINEIIEGIENTEKEKDNVPKYNKVKEKTVRINKILRPSSKEEDFNNKSENKKDIHKSNKNLIQINKNIELNNTMNNRGKKKIPLIDFPSEDIPGIDDEFRHEVYDPPNIHMLRKDKEDKIKNKEKESKVNNNLVKVFKKAENGEKINKNVRPLDSNKFTFDSNGKIISFKQYKIDNLSKDFTFIRNNIKEKEKEKEFNETINIKPRRQSRLQEPIEIVIRDNKNNFYSNEEQKDKKEKEKIIPSGSNFKLILPNIGVVVKENNNVKEGGKEFNKYFKKYSINDYDKILNEYVPLQNRTKIKSKFERMNLTSTMIQKKISESVDDAKINNINNTQINISTINNKKNEKMNISNPLLNSNDNIQITENDNINQNSSYLKTSNEINPLLTSFNMRSAQLNISKDKKNNFMDSIIMKKLGTGSLKLEIDSLEDLRVDKPYHKLKYYKKENIFDKNYIKRNKLRLNYNSKDNPLFAFNKKILTDANFGNKIEQNDKEKENIIISKHLSKQQALKELGNSIIIGNKIKYPRNRKVELSN